MAGPSGLTGRASFTTAVFHPTACLASDGSLTGGIIDLRLMAHGMTLTSRSGCGMSQGTLMNFMPINLYIMRRGTSTQFDTLYRFSWQTVNQLIKQLIKWAFGAIFGSISGTPGAYAMIAGAEDGSIHLLQAMAIQCCGGRAKWMTVASDDIH